MSLLRRSLSHHDESFSLKIMLRRAPTRIDLKLEDKEEYDRFKDKRRRELKRKRKKAHRGTATSPSAGTPATGAGESSSMDMSMDLDVSVDNGRTERAERIGL